MKMMLGTAQWGWTVSREEAFKLLDAWLAGGLRRIDCATNYPIDQNPEHFRAAEKILQEYLIAHGLRDLQLTMKIGSLDNMRSPEVNLNPSFIRMMAEEYQRHFDSNLSCLMFHWDNRENAGEIGASLEALQSLQMQYGLRPGISGVKYPAAYAEANASLGLRFEIQLKHNVLQSGYRHYAPLYGTAVPDTQAPDIFAYGLNAGGVKLTPSYPGDSTLVARGGQTAPVPAIEAINRLLPDWNTAHVRPPIKSMNHIGLVFAGLHPGIQGMVLGFSSVAQLHETLDFWRNLESFDYSDVYSALNKIHLSA